jgi:hypothetical protein
MILIYAFRLASPALRARLDNGGSAERARLNSVFTTAADFSASPLHQSTDNGFAFEPIAIGDGKNPGV